MIQRLLDKLNGRLSCGEVLELLQGYLDDEITAEEARKVSEHLERCDRCERESEVYRQIKENLAARSRPIDPKVLNSLEAFGRSLMD
jgi:anti-sigma factor RsiW